MADLKISELSALAGANLVAADELAIVDDSASETKKITVSDLIANGVTVISDDSIPGAKILFGAGDIATAALADSAVTTAKVADDAITAAKLANESTVDLVTTLPAAGAFTGQLALDTDDNNVYLWDGSAWRGIAAPGSIGNINGSTTGEINIVVSTSGSAVTISATLDDTTSAAQFLAGPTGSAGAVGYRTLVGTDLPTATTTAKGGVIVNGNGLTMDGDTIEVDNSVTASSTNHVVTYDANGLITGGRTIIASDLPLATTTAVGAVSVGDGLAVGAGGELSVDNTITPGTYTKVTVTSKGLVTTATTLAAADIPDHSAAKLTSGTIGTSLIANDSVTADKLADSSTMKFGGALGSDNVTIFPTGDFKGQLFWDETSLDLYFYSGSSFVPITVLSGNLVNAGTYNANTNLVSSVTTAGSSAGFTAGSALPAPVGANLNHYVVVDTSGTGSGAAPSVALAPPDMLLSNGVGTEYRLIDVSNAIAGQTASNISFIASGTIAATDVQAALQEVDSEKLAKAGGTMSGNLELGAGIVIVFEGSAADDYETTLTVTNPTADRTITFPDTTGTVVTTGDTGTVTSAMIADGTIVNADINASAEIAVSKLANGTARQLLQTAANGSDVEFTSNVDVPGTLDVTAAATFDSTVAITGLISANGKVSFPAGTAAAPGIYSGSDTDTGIYSPGSNQFGITTNGASRIVVDSSGLVGIGTTSPQSECHINTSGAGSAFYHATNGSTGGGGTDGMGMGVSGTSAYVWNYESSPMLFGTSATERMRIDGSSGNVGIGATSPVQKLHLNSTSVDVRLALTNSASGSTNSDGCQLQYNNSDLYINNNESGFIQLLTSATPRMTVDNSGNVGVGTSGPDLKLEVSGGQSQTTDQFTNLVRVAANAPGDPATAEMQLNFGIQASNTSTNNRQARIQAQTGEGTGRYLLLNPAGGHVGIGTTSPGAPLHIQKQSAGGLGPEVRLTNNGGSANDKGRLSFYSGTSAPTLRGALDFNIASGGVGELIWSSGETTLSERMRVDSSGRLLLGKTSFNSGLAGLAQVEVSDSQGGLAINSTNTSSTSFGRLFFLANGGLTGTEGLIRYSNNDYHMAFYTAGGERLRIDSSGRLLLGVTTGTAGSNNYLSLISRSTTNTAESFGIQYPGVATYGFSVRSNGDYLIRKDGTDRMRITATGFSKHRGNGAGYYSVGGNYHEFTSDIASYVNIFQNVHQSAPSGLFIKYQATINNNNTSFFLDCEDYAVRRFAVSSAGGVYSYESNNTNLCDEREKKNIVDLDPKWDKVKSWELKKFHYNEDADTDDLRYGVIAQQVETVCPEVLSNWEKQSAQEAILDEDGNVTTPAREQILRKGVKEQQMMWMAIKALQEAQARIETLETKVAQLEAG